MLRYLALKLTNQTLYGKFANRDFTEMPENPAHKFQVSYFSREQVKNNFIQAFFFIVTLIQGDLEQNCVSSVTNCYSSKKFMRSVLIKTFVLYYSDPELKMQKRTITHNEQGRIGYAGTHVPMSVPRLGLIKPGQTYVCPKPWAFSIKFTLWLILHFFENRRLVCPKLRAFSERFVSSCCQ